MNNIIEYLKANKMIAIAGAIGLLLVVSRKVRRMIFGSPTRRRRRPVKVKTVIRANRNRVRTVKRGTKSGRPLPRSAGRARGSAKGYPAAGGGYIPFKRNKDGSIKKAQFVAGTLAAKRRMAALRKNR